MAVLNGKKHRKCSSAIQHVKVMMPHFSILTMMDFLIYYCRRISRKDGRGLFLYHNDGKGKFTDVSDLLPDETQIRQTDNLV